MKRERGSIEKKEERSKGEMVRMRQSNSKSKSKSESERGRI